jgi:hypothetical protein
MSLAASTASDKNFIIANISVAALPPPIGRAPQLARRVACRGGAAQAGFAEIDTLAEPLRVVILVVLRDANPFLLSVSRLLLWTRRDANCYAVRTLRLGNCMAQLSGSSCFLNCPFTITVHDVARSHPQRHRATWRSAV